MSSSSPVLLPSWLTRKWFDDLKDTFATLPAEVRTDFLTELTDRNSTGGRFTRLIEEARAEPTAADPDDSDHDDKWTTVTHVRRYNPPQTGEGSA